MLTDPINGSVGGLLIGLSAAVLLLASGQVLGISGILKGFAESPVQAFSASSSEGMWKLVFLSTSFITTLALTAIMPSFFTPISTISPSYAAQVVAGLLVGFGTTMGNGCTSGHGICGLARLSPRSFVAVGTFLSVGILTTTISVNYLDGVNTTTDIITPTDMSTIIGIFVIALFMGVFISSVGHLHLTAKEKISIGKTMVPPLLASILFTAGLIFSGMIQIARVQGFLNVKQSSWGEWDGTLMFVLGLGVISSFLSYQYKERYQIEKPLLCNKTDGSDCTFGAIPGNGGVITKRLIIGSALFGIGWGLGGLCPGPALVQVANGAPSVLYAWFPAFVVGKRMFPFFEKRGWLTFVGVEKPEVKVPVVNVVLGSNADDALLTQTVTK